jgi:hypothetical protein
MDSADFECSNAAAKERLEDETAYLFIRMIFTSVPDFLCVCVCVVIAVTTTVCLLSGKSLANINKWQAVNRI